MPTIRIVSLLVLATALSTAAFAQPKHPKPAPGAAPHAPPPPQAAPPIAPSDMIEGSTMTTTGEVLPPQTDIRRGLRLGAFIDFEGSFANKTYYPRQGFTVNDAAIYIEKDLGRGLSALIDLPFSTPDTATNVNLGFAGTKAQVYAEYANGAFLGKFGQFDSIYGVEKNDSRDRFFANAGSIKSFLLPVIHSGALVSYGIQDVSLRALFSDPHDVGSLANQNPEFGVQARFDNQKFNAAAGFLYADQKNLQTNSSNMLIDLNAGLSIDQFNASISFDDRKVAGIDKHADGFGLLGSFGIARDLALGARFQYISDPPLQALGGNVTKSVIEALIGPSYKWTPDVTVRGDVGVVSYDYDVADDVTLFGAHISLLANF